MQKLRILYDKIREWGLKKWVHRRMIKDYQKMYQVELLLEQWIIKRILEGNTDRRKELAEKQARIKEITSFINYLNKK